MKKITFVSFYRPDEPTAASSRLKRMIEYFGEQGFSVQLVFPIQFQSQNKAAKAFQTLRQMMDLLSQCKRIQSDCFYVTTPPLFLFFVALGLTFFKRVPVLLEQRDLLTINPITNLKLLRQNFVMRLLEAWTLKRVSAVVVVTEGLKADLIKHFGISHISVIRNGFWEKDFERITATKRSGKIRFIHIGNFYGTRNPFALLKSLAGIPDLEAKVEFAFYGSFETPKDLETAKAYCLQNGLSDFVNFNDPVPRIQALQEVANSDVALLLTHTSGSENAIPAKMFEYIALRKPILAITHDPLVVEALSAPNMGWTTEHVDGIFLNEVLSQIENSRANPSTPPDISKFNAKHQLDILRTLLQGFSPQADSTPLKRQLEV